jgi:long-chain acyl-CoA synthetase
VDATLDDPRTPGRPTALRGGTLLDDLDETCRTVPGAPALVGKEATALAAEGGEAFRTRSWAMVRREASELAMGLYGLGVAQGDVVALAVGQRPEHLLADLGATMLGAVPCPLFLAWDDTTLAAVVADARPTVAVVEDGAALERWRGLGDDVRPPVLVVLDPGDTDLTDGEVAYAELHRDGAERLATSLGELRRIARTTAPDDAALLAYTPGTEGPPTGVVLTHANLRAAVAQLREALDVRPQERTVSFLPLADVTQRLLVHHLVLTTGGSVTFARDPLLLLETLLEARPHRVVGVARVWSKLHTAVTAGIEGEEDERRRKVALGAIAAATEAVTRRAAGERVPAKLRAKHTAGAKVVFTKMRDELGLDQVRHVVSAGGPVAGDLLAFYAAIGAPIVELYGQAETSGVVSCTRPGDLDPGTAGRPLPGTQVRTVDAGELLVRGPQVAAGTWRAAGAPVPLIDDDGWLRTGDRGRVDRDDVVRVDGRLAFQVTYPDGTTACPDVTERALADATSLLGRAVVVSDGTRVGALLALDPEMAPLWCYQHDVPFAGPAELAADARVQTELQRVVDAANVSLPRAHRIERWDLVPELWTADAPELTPAGTVRRAVVLQRHAERIADLLAD